MRKLGDETGGFLASKLLPVALLFVSVAAVVRVLQESGQAPVTRLIGAFLGPWATLAVLLGMCAVGAVWFLKGDISNPFRKILALALVGLPVALLFGVLQPPQLRAHWGGIAGSNLGRVVAALPDTLSAGVAVLVLVLCAWLAWKLAFGAPAVGQSHALAFAGIAAASAARQQSLVEPLSATATLEAEDGLELAEPETLERAPRQSTLFDTLGTAEEAVAAAEAIANAPMESEVQEAENALHVPPWLHTEPERRAEAATTAQELAEEQPLVSAADGTRPALEAPLADISTPENVNALLASEADLEPLVGELELPALEDDADLPAPMAVAPSMLEELEDEELAAEDAAADFTVDDDISAELDDSILSAVPLPRLAVSADPMDDDEFSVAAEGLAAVVAPVVEEVATIAPESCASVEGMPAAPLEPRTEAAPVAFLADASTSAADAFAAAASAEAVPHVRAAQAVIETAPVEEPALFMHPALLALTGAVAAPVAETAAVVEVETLAASEEAVKEPAALIADGDFELTFDEAEDDALMPKPMLVATPDWQGELDELDALELEEATDLAADEEPIENIVEESVIESAPLFDAMEESPVAMAAPAAGDEFGAGLEELLAEVPAETVAAEIVAPEAAVPEIAAPSPEPTLTFVPPMPAEDVDARPQFTLLRGGPEATPAPEPLPHHLAAASLEPQPVDVPSSSPAPRKKKSRSKESSGWADWEESPRRAKRNAASADDAGQALLFAGGNELDPDLVQRAEELVVAEARCSELMLQRKLELSWAEASRIIERLEARGIVSPADPSGRRNVLSRERSADADNGF